MFDVWYFCWIPFWCKALNHNLVGLRNQRWLMLSKAVSFQSHLEWEEGPWPIYKFVPWVEATNRTKWSIWGFPEVDNTPDLARATGKPWTSKWRYLWNQCSRARLAVKHDGNGHMSKMFFFAMRCGLLASGWATKVLGRWERFWSWGWSEELVV